MDHKILIASPDLNLGNQISQTLRESGYSALLAPSTAEAAFIIQDERCPIAIVDCNLPDPGPVYLAAELRARFKDLRIIFIHPTEGSSEPFKIDPARDIYLPRPFFMPDLLEVVHLWVTEKKILQEESKAPKNEQAIPAKLAWLQDVNLAAQYLTRLSLEADAHAALIIRETQMWAYAGQLSKAAAEELTRYVGYHWANGDGNDLARFVRLETTGNEYMLYATRLGSGFVLALSFVTEMPFSKMRTQTGTLARKLTGPIPDLANEAKKKSSPGKPLQVENDLELSKVDWEPELGDDSEPNESAWSDDDSLDKNQQVLLQDLQTTFDTQNLDKLSNSEASQTITEDSGQVELQFQKPAYHQDSHKRGPFVIESDHARADKIISKTELRLESESLALHDLAYVCVLIPRFPDHHIEGILSGLLKVEVARLCLAFGWRLEQLIICSQYLQWEVSVSPDVPAIAVIQNIREQTSSLIFNEFPRLVKENPSCDFWAPGFLVVHSRKAISESLIDDYIRQTRQRQGIH